MSKNKSILFFSFLLSLTFCNIAQANEYDFKSEVGITFVDNLDNTTLPDELPDGENLERPNLPQTGDTRSVILTNLGLVTIAVFVGVIYIKKKE